MAKTKKTIFISSLAAATKPALNKRESHGKKKPSKSPVSMNTIPEITT